MSSGRRPNVSPHHESGSSTSYANGTSPLHLRNRSQGGSQYVSDPFDDRNIAQQQQQQGRSSPPLVPMPPLAQPTPHRAALMAASHSEASLVQASEREQAMNMRGPKAEWVRSTLFSQLAKEQVLTFSLATA